MRVCHVVHTLNPDKGGPSESVRMFVMAHQRAGFHVEVATLDDLASGYDRVVNCKVHPCGPGLFNYGYSPRLVQWLKANRDRFDGFVVNGIWQFHSVAVRKALAGHTPYVVFTHGMLDPYFKDRYPLKHFKKLIYWILEEHRNLNQATSLCFTSEEEKRIAGEGFPFRRFRGVVIPYGTIGPSGEPEELKAAFLKDFPALTDKPYLLFLGRIHPKKGCDLLLEAFAKAAPPDLQLVMAGPDETGWRPALEAQAARLGLTDRVHWTGMLRGSAKWGSFFAAEAFILPSHQENFGIAVSDALSCGLIPLISDKVNIAAEVADDNAGLMEPDTEEGTQRLIERFLAMSQTERSEMRRRALECYQRRYSMVNSALAVHRALSLA